MTVAFRQPITPDDVLDWAERQDGRHEFDGSRPVAMTGGSADHARITGNIAFELRSRLPAGGPCEPFGSDAGIRTADDAIRFPDALVTCTPFDGRNRLVPDPVIVFEVTSPSSIREDRILKPAEYAAIPSIRRYVLVEQSVIGLTMLSHERDEPWHFQTLKTGDTLLLPELGFEIPVDSFYARVSLD